MVTGTPLSLIKELKYDLKLLYHKLIQRGLILNLGILISETMVLKTECIKTIQERWFIHNRVCQELGACLQVYAITWLNLLDIIGSGKKWKLSKITQMLLTITVTSITQTIGNSIISASNICMYLVVDCSIIVQSYYHRILLYASLLHTIGS